MLRATPRHSSVRLDSCALRNSRWNSNRLPLDVWGLDMNWRNTTDVQTCGVAHNHLDLVCPATYPSMPDYHRALCPDFVGVATVSLIPPIAFFTSLLRLHFGSP